MRRRRRSGFWAHSAQATKAQKKKKKRKIGIMGGGKGEDIKKSKEGGEEGRYTKRAGFGKFISTHTATSHSSAYEKYVF